VSAFVYREATSDDWPFIAGSFAHEYQSTSLLGNDDFKRIVMPLFHAEVRAGKTVVAHPASEPTEIAGWVSYKPRALVFAVVKRPYRGLGVWRGLRDLCANLSDRRAVWPCIFKPRGFSDERFVAAPWMALI
jgi:hypothetical protein